MVWLLLPLYIVVGVLFMAWIDRDFSIVEWRDRLAPARVFTLYAFWPLFALIRRYRPDFFLTP